MAKLVKTETYISNQQAKQTSTYTIPKMDCSAEEQMVRMALADIEAVKGLTFDLPNRKLKVFHNEGIQQITAKLRRTGFWGETLMKHSFLQAIYLMNLIL